MLQLIQSLAGLAHTQFHFCLSAIVKAQPMQSLISSTLPPKNIMKDYNPYLDDGQYYSVKEVAHLYLASVPTIYRWLKSKRIKSRKYKKRYKITGKHLRAFAMAGHGISHPYIYFFRRKKPYPEPLKRGY